MIAAIGLWRLGRQFGGFGEHDQARKSISINPGVRELIGLGLAGGLVPCWDAVVLVVLAEAVGRLAFGLALLTAFSAGMACVLVTVGIMAARVRELRQEPGQQGCLGQLARSAHAQRSR